MCFTNRGYLTKQSVAREDGALCSLLLHENILEHLGPVLQGVDIKWNLFAIDINRNHVHKR